jgi:hypothetical protein
MSPLCSMWVFVTMMLVSTECMTMDKLKERVAAAAAAEPPVEAMEVATQAKLLGGIAVTGSGSGSASFTGTFLPQTSQVIGGLLNVVGPLTGTVVGTAGAALGTVTQTVSMVVNQASASCQNLHLGLGSQNVNLLGTDITLAPTNIDVNTNTVGLNNLLLGPLLCSVSGLLGTGLVTLTTLPGTLLGLVAAILAQVLSLVFGLTGGLL